MQTKVCPESKTNYTSFSLVGFLPALVLTDEGVFVLHDLYTRSSDVIAREEMEGAAFLQGNLETTPVIGKEV
ncbi:hypothetical protein STEG23_016386, partial [Scotinomys teguina]